VQVGLPGFASLIIPPCDALSLRPPRPGRKEVSWPFRPFRFGRQIIGDTVLGPSGG
jgi:hypothetical protein